MLRNCLRFFHDSIKFFVMKQFFESFILVSESLSPAATAGISPAATAGISITAIIAVIAALLAAYYFLIIRKRQKKRKDSKTVHSARVENKSLMVEIESTL